MDVTTARSRTLPVPEVSPRLSNPVLFLFPKVLYFYTPKGENVMDIEFLSNLYVCFAQKSCETVDPCQGTQQCKDMEVPGNIHCPDPHQGSTCHAAENTKPSDAWERHCLLEFAMGCPNGMDFCCSCGVWSWAGYQIEIPVCSGPTHIPSKGIHPAVGYVEKKLLSSLSGLPWWVSPLQGSDWKVLKQYIKEEQARTSTLTSSDMTNTDAETWSMAINNTGHRYSFSVTQTIKAVHQIANQEVLQIPPAESWVASHIWDGFTWLTLDHGHLSTWILPCWKQKNHSKYNQPNYTRNMGWISLELCSHSVTLKNSD
ncbi:uncharacterized protein LOC109490178 isoform X3 [Ailuropoda melanoleuca]|uniref:uncharacterized protein LOC109490178 isoform X3 n=1 Tax=Ailuropoda melanoleuca TaxID=9646 RepID=UPI001494F04B|nr:uncharacterized protein LOC109490178 isoform X3 [Ailuropoda melanoleuca]